MLRESATIIGSMLDVFIVMTQTFAAFIKTFTTATIPKTMMTTTTTGK
jgi:hypothetical protein